MRARISDLLLGAAELLGRMLGYAKRSGFGWSLVEIVGATCIVVGVGQWSQELGLVVLGAMLIAVSWVHSRKTKR